MRTTLTIADDVLEAARGLAEAQRVSLGEALSTLARRGMKQIGLRPSRSGLLVFDVPDDFPEVTSDDVARMMADFP